ncbi:MAG: hypothetical protein ACFFDN_11585, partial [Candidatus Hodarchaeota archaeon]
MSDILQNEILKQVNELFRQAEEEERKCNWNKEIEILKKIEKISLDNKLKKIEGEIYFKLGEIYHIATHFEKTEVEVLKNYQLAISNFQKAHNTFEELKKEGYINASLGLINLLKYISGSEEPEEEFLLESAKKYFNKAKLIYLEKGNSILSLNMAILESRALELIIGEKSIRVDEHSDFIKLASEFKNLTTKLIARSVHQPDFSEIYYFYLGLSIVEFFTWSVFSLSIEDLKI